MEKFLNGVIHQHVLGAEKQWLQQFEGLTLRPAADYETINLQIYEISTRC